MNFDCRRQIKEKDENVRQHQREHLEDGRKMKQHQDQQKKKLEMIKNSKLNELKNLNINSKYVSDLERYKAK